MNIIANTATDQSVPDKGSAVLTKQPVPNRFVRDPFVLLVLLVLIVGFGSFIFWSTTAQLSEGVTASGSLNLETKRRTVQHLEGGIISKLQVKEGQSVQAGDLLIELEDIQSRARRDQVLSRVQTFSANLDRLHSQLNNESSIHFKRLENNDLEASQSIEIKHVQQQIFDDERAALAGQRSVLESRIQGIKNTMAGLSETLHGKRAELSNLQTELSLQKSALAQQMGNISRVNEVSRQVNSVKTDIQELRTQQQTKQSEIAEIRNEILQLQLSFRAELSKKVSETAISLSEAQDELLKIEDVLQRTQILAPQTGTIIDLQYQTIGGVIRAGEPILSIIPSSEKFIVEAKILPQNRDELQLGRQVNLRFGTLDPINPPEAIGTLQQIDADISFDDKQQAQYYKAEVILDAENIAKLSKFELVSGIPVEVFFDKGTTRTPISYFWEPIERMLRLGMRG
jgi:HlyD family type I secretion membrane fusion protein